MSKPMSDEMLEEMIRAWSYTTVKPPVYYALRELQACRERGGKVDRALAEIRELAEAAYERGGKDYLLMRLDYLVIRLIAILGALDAQPEPEVQG